MKAYKFLAVASVLTSTALAQTPGFFVSAGGGVARINVGSFTVYNPDASIQGQPQGEALGAVDRKDNVSVARLTAGYTVNENWDVRLSYTGYGTGEAKVAFPLYTGYAWGVGGGAPTFQRHVLKYKTTALTLMPSYTYAAGEKSRVILGAGINYGMTTSHFEETYITGASVAPVYRIPTSFSYAEETDHSLGYILSLGFSRLITDNFSAEVTGNYSTFKTKVPTSPWATRSKSSVSATALSAELALIWHW